MRAEEVFTLQPGQARLLEGWVNLPICPPPGEYSATLWYRQEPDGRWRGWLFRAHDPGAIHALRNSTAVSVVSNRAELVVTP